MTCLSRSRVHGYVYFFLLLIKLNRVSLLALIEQGNECKSGFSVVFFFGGGGGGGMDLSLSLLCVQYV